MGEIGKFNPVQAAGEIAKEARFKTDYNDKNAQDKRLKEEEYREKAKEMKEVPLEQVNKITAQEEKNYHEEEKWKEAQRMFGMSDSQALNDFKDENDSGKISREVAEENKRRLKERDKKFLEDF